MIYGLDARTFKNLVWKIASENINDDGDHDWNVETDPAGVVTLIPGSYIANAREVIERNADEQLRSLKEGRLSFFNVTDIVAIASGLVHDENAIKVSLKEKLKDSGRFRGITTLCPADQVRPHVGCRTSCSRSLGELQNLSFSTSVSNCSPSCILTGPHSGQRCQTRGSRCAPGTCWAHF